jgi:hypothetical protein
VGLANLVNACVDGTSLSTDLVPALSVLPRRATTSRGFLAGRDPTSLVVRFATSSARTLVVYVHQPIACAFVDWFFSGFKFLVLLYAPGFPLTTLVTPHATWPSFSRVLVFSTIHAEHSQKVIGRRRARILISPAFYTAKQYRYISRSSCETPSVGFCKDSSGSDACLQ